MRDSSSTYTFAANDNGRNASASLNSATVGSYLYNAFEQRAQKIAGAATTQFVYDRAGHLLEEANASGVVQKEYIWLDDLPVAMVDDTGSSPVLYFIHTDQLGTPQKITDGSASVVWDGAFDPFGNAVSLGGSLWGTAKWGSFSWGGLTNNLRFPGQYADTETALNQNWNRDYDPTLGRYVESDPIGLRGGINTYSYVFQNPEAMADQTGLAFVDCVKAIADLIDATNDLKKRLDEADSYGGADKGHAKAIKQAKNRLENAKQRVQNGCGCVAGAAGALAAAAAAAAAAEAALSASGWLSVILAPMAL